MKELRQQLLELKGKNIDISLYNIMSSNFIIEEVEEDFVILRNSLSNKKWIVPLGKINYVTTAI